MGYWHSRCHHDRLMVCWLQVGAEPGVLGGDARGVCGGVPAGVGGGAGRGGRWRGGRGVGGAGLAAHLPARASRHAAHHALPLGARHAPHTQLITNAANDILYLMKSKFIQDLLSSGMLTASW